MNALMNKVVFLVAPPAAIVDNAAITCNVIDGSGYTDLEVLYIFGAMDIAVATMKAQESDVKASATTLTSGADIVGTRFGTDNNDTDAASTLPSATADNTVFSMKIDLRGRKRYVLPVITAGDGAAGTYCTVLAILSRPSDAPRTAAEAGLNQRMVV